MSYFKRENNDDSEIQEILRDANEFAHSDQLDTPSFMQSLDLPTPTGDSGQLFDSFNTELEKQIQQDQLNTSNGDPTGLEHRSLGHFSDFPNNSGLKIIGPNKDNSQTSYSSALTKVHHELPPLTPLSEPVIPANVHLHDHRPNPVQGSSSIPYRPQQLLLTNKRKKDSQTPKARPAFVMKIWTMVNDPKNHDFIRWDEDGETFQVVHREEFMKNILPKYFKHNNFASFVRQLNMYGWHKVQDINSGSMRDDKCQDEVLKFKNPFFKQGREDLLDNIVRNKTGSSEDLMDVNLLNLQYIMSELDLIKMNQLAIIEDMRRMRKDNQVLWTESFGARDRNQKQAQTLEKIMKFLAAIYGNSEGKIFEVGDHGFDDHRVSPYGNSASNLSYAPGLQSSAPTTKPQLMLMDQEYRKPGLLSENSPSVVSNGIDSVEEIKRNTPEFQNSPDISSNANRIYQQIMNPESHGTSSPSQYFPELSNSYFNSKTGEFDTSDIDRKLRDHEDEFLGLEENIVKQGKALLQVQDWIQALANKQQQQQEQIHQRQRTLGDQHESSNGIDDFDVDEFLDNTSIPTSYQETSPLNTPDLLLDGGKRAIEEIQDEKPARNKRRKKT